VEQARAIQKLQNIVSEEKQVGFFAILLGFPPNKKVFDKIIQIGLLPDEVQVGLMEEKISMEAAVSLQGLSEEDALRVFDLLANLKMSQNKQKEIITTLKEIAVIEDLDIASVFQQLGIEEILERTDVNRNEKGTTIRKELKKRRFPNLTKAEKRFKKAVQDLKLDDAMHITPPPYFEGKSYVLRMDFKSVEDLEGCEKSLRALVNNPAMKRLLEPNE
jgi:hypothetical protein